MTQKCSQSGNMLIYIIGAVFLLGILLVAMRSGYQPGAGIDSEAVTLKVTQVRKYATELERGVTFVMSNSGVSETDIRFAHVSAAAGYGTPGAAPLNRQVFEPTGGGVEWKAPPSGIQTTTSDYVFVTDAIDGIGTTCGTSACSDLITVLQNVTKDACIALNDSIGITNPSSDAPVLTAAIPSFTAFQGTFTGTATVATTGAYTFAKNEACVKFSTAYYYYRVLKAR